MSAQAVETMRMSDEERAAVLPPGTDIVELVRTHGGEGAADEFLGYLQPHLAALLAGEPGAAEGLIDTIYESALSLRIIAQMGGQVGIERAKERAHDAPVETPEEVDVRLRAAFELDSTLS